MRLVHEDVLTLIRLPFFRILEVRHAWCGSAARFVTDGLRYHAEGAREIPAALLADEGDLPQPIKFYQKASVQPMLVLGQASRTISGSSVTTMGYGSE